MAEGRRRSPLDRRLLKRVPVLRRHLGVCAGAAVLQASAILLQAEAVSRALPRLIEAKTSALRPLVAALLVVAGLFALARFVIERSAARTMVELRRSLTDLVLDRVEALDEAGRASLHPDSVRALTTSGIDALEPWVGGFLPAVTAASLIPFVAGLRILAGDRLSALALVLTVPLIPVFLALIGLASEQSAQRQWAALRRLAEHYRDVLVGLPTLRLFGRASAQIETVHRAAEHYRRVVMRALRVAFLSSFAMELLSTISVAIIAVSIGVRLTEGAMTLQTALVVLLLAPECSAPLRRLGASYHSAVAGIDAADELDGLLALSVVPDGNATVPPASPGEQAIVLACRSVTVRDAIRGVRVGGVDVEVRAGELVALSGPSGAGKTTLLDALRCQMPVDEGVIELHGVALQDLSRSARTAAVAWAPQRAAALGIPVRESVALGTGAAADAIDEMLSALGIADLAGKPDTALSGGELRRVSVARCLLRASQSGSLLVLCDEPTAHLDAELRQAVIGLLRHQAREGRAVLVATHDPLLVEAADRVVRLASPASSALAWAGEQHSPDDVTAAGSGERSERDGAGSVPVFVDEGAGSTRWLHAVAPRSRSLFVSAWILGIAAEGSAVALAATSAWLIVRASERPSFAALSIAAVGVRSFALGRATFRYVERLALHDATFRKLGTLRSRIVEHLGRVAPLGLRSWGDGDVVTRATDDLDRVADLELRVVAPILSAAVVVTVGCVAVGVASVASALVLAAGAALAMLVLPGFALRSSSSTLAAIHAAKGGLGTEVLNFAVNADLIEAQGGSAVRRATVDAALDSIAERTRSIGRRRAGLGAISVALAPVSVAAIAVIVATAAVSGPVKGLLVLVPFAVFEILAPLHGAGESLAAVRAALGRLHALFATTDVAPDPGVPVALGAATNLRLDDATIGWTGTSEAAVVGLDLRLGEGQRLLLHGPSGSGKSTVAAALVRFLHLRSGSYGIGGIDAARCAGAEIRTAVTWCQQVPWFARASLGANMRIASPSATDDDIRTALSTVSLEQWFEALPEGLDTALGEDGAAVSGGQAQRLALARVLLARHRVVVLDEPTAHLDAELAGVLMEDLLRALDGRSVLVLAHQVPAGPHVLSIDSQELAADRRA